MTKEQRAVELDRLNKSKELVGKYRQALGWSRDGGVGASQKDMMDDIENFCGLNQACFKGSESDMVKNLGRIEVLGRIRFFLNFSDGDMARLTASIEEMSK